jgi:hypothetical protein
MMTDSAARRKRNLYAALTGLTAALLLIGVFLWGAAAAQRSEVLASNTATLAEQVKQACATGQLLVDDRNLCEKANQIAAAPANLVPGPPGPKGAKGEDGKDGVGIPGKDGSPGKDSTIPGPAGKDGSPGRDSTVPGPAGANSVVPGPPGKDGRDGKDGADSTVPGPAGTDGQPGKDGADGKSPTSFTFTDKTGTTYTCTPNPPGSSTYTCEASKPGVVLP